MIPLPFLVLRFGLLLSLCGFLTACAASGPSGRVVFGHARAPLGAPEPVQKAVAAGNRISGKPYKWGGGHGSFEDSGYDCSGTVSCVLGRAGLLAAPLDSRSLMSYGERGRGRWITVYARNGHAFLVVAGLRMDTTGQSGEDGPGWRDEARDLGGYVARHPAGL
jgi:hypothetical protein